MEHQPIGLLQGTDILRVGLVPFAFLFRCGLFFRRRGLADLKDGPDADGEQARGTDTSPDDRIFHSIHIMVAPGAFFKGKHQSGKSGP